MMRVHETRLAGAFILDLDRHEDERGYFARTFCRNEFAAAGLPTDFPQCNTSHNIRRGTLRGMHFQKAPAQEGKLVRCTHGTIYDVIIDLRSGSATRGEWIAVELSRENGCSLYIPQGFAHGFQALEPGSDVLYYMTEFYAPEYATGVRWNDTAFNIFWPIADPILSARDRDFPDYSPDTMCL
jgi:dTDP-4-dehydrorhamnose 3,5-epimerase